MLIICPDCQLQVSDKAASCPHCGYPMKPGVKISRRRRMRLPNGFGQISEIKNQRLREPFRAMITVGTNQVTGRPICELLKPKAYFRTYNEAYQALVEYHKTPYEKALEITMDDFFNEWIEKHEANVSAHRAQSLRTAWKRCEPIAKHPVSSVHVRDLKSITDVDMQPSARRRLKEMLNMLFDYAVENELVSENPARKYKVDSTKANPDAHMSFTDEELKTLWANQGNAIIDAILINCYSGWRPNELMSMKTENINLTDWTFTSGSKTEAGMNRTIPIHSAIREIVERNINGKLLFGWDYNKYRRLFKEAMTNYGLNPNHKTHDCRVQFVTMAKISNMDEYAVKRIVGHAIDDLTERVYSKRGFDWLAEEMEKIKTP